MADIQKKSKVGTIAQAILAVMNAEKRALISQEICQLILERNLYHFNTNDSHGMVYNALWRHSSKTNKHSSSNKFFYKDGNKWAVICENNHAREIESTKIEEIDIEASIYDYLFELEDLESIEL
jgi:hypothetical protein